MPQVPLNLINQQVELLGELVTITVKSARTYSDWGDETATETDTTDVKAIYNVYSRESASNAEGKFQGGELTFFFKSDQEGIVNGTKITRENDETFSIDDVRAHGIQGGIYVKEAVVQKV